MDEEPSTSGGIKRHIPLELQNEIDELALKHPREAAIQDALDDNTKRWLVVGICLHSVISPALRKYVDSILTVFHNELISFYKIDVQIYSGHLKRYPHSGFFLNYEAVNNNKANYGRNIAKYDYTIKDAVDLSKLFLQTHMAHYTCFDETCDSSALLGLILNIAKFDPIIKSDADDVRTIIRNPWAHCNFTAWDAAKCSDSFQLMKKLVKDLKLSLNEEKLIFDELEKWEINGQRFLSGTTHGLELVRELQRETHALAKYATSVATETDDDLKRLNKELMKFEIIFNQMADLQRDMKNRFSEVDKKLLTQDKTVKKHSTQIEELEEDMNKCACRDSHKADIEFWKEQEVMFVETPVVDTVLEKLEKQHITVLIGEPGIGKSTLMHHIALQQQNKYQYIIIPCSEIREICLHFREGIKQIFVLDDICGRFTVSCCDIKYLQKNEDTLKRIIEKKQTKIVATCRLDIFNDKKFLPSSSVFTSNTINLSEKYSKEDKLKIGKQYLQKGDIQLLKYQTEPFTPLMCYLYSKNENFNLTDFLHSPYETYRNEWDTLQSTDSYKYCALFLCVIFNGTIDESFFDIYNENITIDKKALKNIFDICGLNGSTAKSTMKWVLDSMIGTYVRKTENEYKVIHDKMFDFMCYYFGNKDTMVRSILRYACMDVVNERAQLESINERYDNFTIHILEKYEQDYFARIQNDLQSGQLNQCFNNAQMKLAKYRTAFLKVIQSIDNAYLIENHIIQETLITSCFRGYDDIIKYFISIDVDLNKGYSDNTPLTAACMAENEMIVQLLIETGAEVNQVNGMWETPLTVACSTKNEKIARFLIDKGGDVNKVNGTWDTPLLAACKANTWMIVQLLIDKGCDVNQVNGMGDTPLTVACDFGNEYIVQLLLNNGCDVNQVNGMSYTPLTTACQINVKKEIVQLLIDKGGDVNQVDEIGETPLTTACNRGNEKIVQLLLDNGSDVNQVDDMRETPLTVACMATKKKIVQLLIEKGGDVNQVDGIGQTPLTAACRKLNILTVKLLIDQGSDVNQVDGMKETPLTVACKFGNEDIAQLLIDKECDVNQVDGNGNTPLTLARKSGNTNLAQLCIDKVCDVTPAYEEDSTDRKKSEETLLEVRDVHR